MLAEALSGLEYVWLRRRDKLRQAISWWRADVTGQYATSTADVPLAAPAYDRDAIARALRFAEECDEG